MMPKPEYEHEKTVSTIREQRENRLKTGSSGQVVHHGICAETCYDAS